MPWDNEIKDEKDFRAEIATLKAACKKLKEENERYAMKHGDVDAAEDEHFESCECCGYFHRLEMKYDEVMKASKEMLSVIEGRIANAESTEIDDHIFVQIDGWEKTLELRSE